MSHLFFFKKKRSQAKSLRQFFVREVKAIKMLKVSNKRFVIRELKTCISHDYWRCDQSSEKYQIN